MEFLCNSRKSVFFSGLVSFCLIGTACGKQNAANEQAPTQNGLTITDGTWIKSCAKEDDGTYTKETMTTLGAALSLSITSYNDQECKSEENILELKGAFSTVGNNIDVAFGKASVKPLNDTELKELETMCPGINFKIGELSEILTCELGKTLSKGIFQTYYASSTQITLGKPTASLDGTSAAKRPILLDADNPYKKQ